MKLNIETMMSDWCVKCNVQQIGMNGSSQTNQDEVNVFLNDVVHVGSAASLRSGTRS
jgi:hypothetical protein